MIVRTKKDSGDFFVMHKHAMNDNNLSFKAKGLLAYLMSKPENWEVHVSDLVKHSKDGESAVRSAMEELERNGYMVRSREHTKEGLFTWVVTVHETPIDKSERTSPDKRKHSAPFGGFPQMDKPQMENHYPTNNDLSHNDNSDNEEHINESKNDSLEQTDFMSSVEDLQTLEERKDEDTLLFDTVNTSRKNKGQRPQRRKFKTLPQKEKWREAARLIMQCGDNIPTQAQLKALSSLLYQAQANKGIYTLDGLINYVAKCADQKKPAHNIIL